jgi:hypothetical protein
MLSGRAIYVIAPLQLEIDLRSFREGVAANPEGLEVPISFVPHFPKTLSEKKRRRPVVVLKVLGGRKAALALGFKTFWCTDMGLLVCSYGELALRPEKPTEFSYGVQIWGFSVCSYGVFFWCANLLLYMYTI